MSGGGDRDACLVVVPSTGHRGCTGDGQPGEQRTGRNHQRRCDVGIAGARQGTPARGHVRTDPRTTDVDRRWLGRLRHWWIVGLSQAGADQRACNDPCGEDRRANLRPPSCTSLRRLHGPPFRCRWHRLCSWLRVLSRSRTSTDDTDGRAQLQGHRPPRAGHDPRKFCGPPHADPSLSAVAPSLTVDDSCRRPGDPDEGETNATFELAPGCDTPVGTTPRRTGWRGSQWTGGRRRASWLRRRATIARPAPALVEDSSAHRVPERRRHLRLAGDPRSSTERLRTHIRPRTVKRWLILADVVAVLVGIAVAFADRSRLVAGRVRHPLRAVAHRGGVGPVLVCFGGDEPDVRRSGESSPCRRVQAHRRHRAVRCWLDDRRWRSSRRTTTSVVGGSLSCSSASSPRSPSSGNSPARPSPGCAGRVGCRGRILVVGTDDNAASLVQTVQQRPELGYWAVGFVAAGDVASRPARRSAAGRPQQRRRCRSRTRCYRRADLAVLRRRPNRELAQPSADRRRVARHVGLEPSRHRHPATSCPGDRQPSTAVHRTDHSHRVALRRDAGLRLRRCVGRSAPDPADLALGDAGHPARIEWTGHLPTGTNRGQRAAVRDAQASHDVRRSRGHEERTHGAERVRRPAVQDARRPTRHTDRPPPAQDRPSTNFPSSGT